MTQEQFEAAHGTQWAEFAVWLDRRTSPRKTENGLQISEVPARYRALCSHLAVARDRQYTSALIDRLNDLALQGHNALYTMPSRRLSRIGAFFSGGFPQLVRAEWRYVILAALLYFVPLIACIIALQLEPQLIYKVMPANQVASFEKMYGNNAAAIRSAAQDVGMWGFYIGNNIKIDFQCFAGGILFGIGSAFYLLLNGIQHGSVAGYLTQQGFGEHFWGFVAGHSSFELIGAVLAGAAGLRLGAALISPGRKRRAAALKLAAKPAIALLGGAASMTFTAAFIEGFWSPAAWVGFEVKVGVGLLLWAALLTYFMFVGRAHHAA